MSKPSSIRFPAEWEPHQATLLTWPHNPTDWPGKMTAVRSTYIEIARILSRYEPVWILSTPKESPGILRQLKEMNADLSNITVLDIPTDRSWARDYGPVTVYENEKQRLFRDFLFNGWARFPAHQKDQNVASKLAAFAGVTRTPVRTNNQPVVLEGGSIDTNGQGILLTTKECLLSDSRQKRNPHLTREDLEQVFAESLGIEKTLWLNRGIEGDDTHGHVDDITRFVNPTTILTMEESNPHDPNHACLTENLRILEDSHLHLLPLHMPSPLYHKGHRLPASYANFYIANHCVLVPTFNDPRDRDALGVISECFPDRTVIGIHAVDLLTGLGGPHCITMQIPEKK